MYIETWIGQTIVLNGGSFNKLITDCALIHCTNANRPRSTFNPLVPGRPISAANKSKYIPRRTILAACETSFLDRSQRHLLINFGTITAFPGARRTLVLNACGFYISWCTKFGQIFHLNLGTRLAIHGSMHNGIL
jgi:hypothetical protein